MAFSDSQDWKFEHPETFYAWEGTCIWIPCRYTIPGNGKVLDNLTVYQNYEWDSITKNFNGAILYEEKKFETSASKGRVQFLGDNKSNCTLHIHPVNAQDNGHLGLRVTSGNDKWMDKIVLNISSKAMGDGVLCLCMGKEGSGKPPLLGQGPQMRLPAEARQGVPVGGSGSTYMGLWPNWSMSTCSFLSIPPATQLLPTL